MAAMHIGTIAMAPRLGLAIGRALRLRLLIDLAKPSRLGVGMQAGMGAR